MRLKYFFICLSTGTLLSLLYTWQQIEIIKLAYQENSKNNAYKEMLDRNHYLRYNLSGLKSVLSLGNKLLDGTTNFELPKTRQMLTLVLPNQDTPLETIVQPKNLKSFLPGFSKGRFAISISKLQNALPLSIVKSLINKQAQAQDFNR